jgi:hypothetical protein
LARAWRRHESIPLVLAVVAFLWFTFLSVSVAFSLVHYEARHALPILPAGCIGIVYAFSAARQWLGRRKPTYRTSEDVKKSQNLSFRGGDDSPRARNP